MSERAGGDRDGRDADALDGGADSSDTETVRTDGAPTVRPHQAPPGEGGFDWHGGLLVGALIVAFLVIPAAILFLPEAEGLIESLGLSLRDAYLTLPMIPAVCLAVIAVWAAVRTRTR